MLSYFFSSWWQIQNELKNIFLDLLSYIAFFKDFSVLLAFCSNTMMFKFVYLWVMCLILLFMGSWCFLFSSFLKKIWFWFSFCLFVFFCFFGYCFLPKKTKKVELDWRWQGGKALAGLGWGKAWSEYIVWKNYVQFKKWKKKRGHEVWSKRKRK